MSLALMTRAGGLFKSDWPGTKTETPAGARRAFLLWWARL